MDYFKKRHFIQGISDSYTLMRENPEVVEGKGGIIRKLLTPVFLTFVRYRHYSSSIFRGQFDYVVFNELAVKYHSKGMKFHRTEVMNDRKLLEYIVQDTYLDEIS